MKRRTRSIMMPAALGIGLAGLAACTKHEITMQPIRVEPIHMTLDVNIKVDRELDEFFDFREEPAPDAMPVPETTEPAETPAGGAQ